MVKQIVGDEVESPRRHLRNHSTRGRLLELVGRPDVLVVVVPERLVAAPPQAQVASGGRVLPFARLNETTEAGAQRSFDRFLLGGVSGDVPVPGQLGIEFELDALGLVIDRAGREGAIDASAAPGLDTTNAGIRSPA